MKHLCTSHKFEDNEIANLRSRARNNPGTNRLASSFTTADTALPVSTFTGQHAALGAPAAGLQSLVEYAGGSVADPFGTFHDGAADIPMGSVAPLQPPSIEGQQMLLSASWGFAGLDNSHTGLAGTGAPGAGLSFAGCPCIGCLCTGLPGSGCICTGLPGHACFCAWLSGGGDAGGDVANVDVSLEKAGVNNGI